MIFDNAGAACIGVTVLIAVILGGTETRLDDTSDVLVAVAAIVITTFMVVWSEEAEESLF